MDRSSGGYWTLTSTAIRISNAYSRQTSYSLSFGVAQKGVAPALLSPSKYSKTFEEMLGSYQKEGIDRIGFGYLSSRLVGDYTRKDTYCRDKTMNVLVDEYKKANSNIGAILADEANAYILPYVSTVSGVPVSSSGYDITDFDIPFYQMVIHGYVPFSTKAINASSNTDLTFMRALAAGSNVNYDMIYEDADELLDTRDDDYFYSHYSGWITAAANQYKVASKVLAAVSDYTISDYVVEGSVIKTTYSKDGQADVVIEVDTAKQTVKVGGETIDLVAEGAVEEGGANG